jgi:hypothetical protein
MPQLARPDDDDRANYRQAKPSQATKNKNDKNRPTVNQTTRQTGRKMGTQTGRQTDRQTTIRITSQTNRQATDKQTYLGSVTSLGGSAGRPITAGPELRRMRSPLVP